VMRKGSWGQPEGVMSGHRADPHACGCVGVSAWLFKFLDLVVSLFKLCLTVSLCLRALRVSLRIRSLINLISRVSLSRVSLVRLVVGCLVGVSLVSSLRVVNLSRLRVGNNLNSLVGLRVRSSLVSLGVALV